MPIARTTDTPSTARAAPVKRATSISPAFTEGTSTESVTHPRTKDETTVAAANSVVPTPPIANCRAARLSWRQMRAAPRPPTGRLGAAVEARFTTPEGIVGLLPPRNHPADRLELHRDLCRHPAVSSSTGPRGPDRPSRRPVLCQQGRGGMVGDQGPHRRRRGRPAGGGPRVPGGDRLAAPIRAVDRVGRGAVAFREASHGVGGGRSEERRVGK